MLTSQRARVRQGFTEESIWRDSFGGSEALLCFVTYGPIDAPDNMPAGSMRSIPAKYGGSAPNIVDRDGIYT